MSIPLEVYKHACKTLQYNPSTGVVTRKFSNRSVKKGNIVGFSNSKGYLRTKVTFMSTSYTISLHKFAFFCNKGYVPSVVDHGNRIPWDNREVNLRECTHMQNSHNRKVSRKSASGVTGVTKRKGRKYWSAVITYNYKKINLGSFEKFEDAVIARKEAEDKYFGEFKPRN